MLTKDQALAIAKRKLSESGYVERHVDVDTAKAELIDGHWMFVFQRKGRPPMPGGHGVVSVNAESGTAEILPGE